MMLHQTAIIDSKDESFPFDFNLQDINHNIDVEISPGKYEWRAFVYWSKDDQICQLSVASWSSQQADLYAVFFCSIFMRN